MTTDSEGGPERKTTATFISLYKWARVETKVRHDEEEEEFNLVEFFYIYYGDRKTTPGVAFADVDRRGEGESRPGDSGDATSDVQRNLDAVEFE